MILKLLGIIDIAMALTVAFVGLGVDPGKIYLAVMLAHALKATIFIKDVLSLIDIAIVIYTIILPFYSNSLINIIIVVFLFFKGVYSFA